MNKPINSVSDLFDVTQIRYLAPEWTFEFMLLFDSYQVLFRIFMVGNQEKKYVS